MTKRLLCFVNERIEVVLRTDLMSNLMSTIWLELKGSNKKGSNKKVLICAIYREFNDLTGEGQMSIGRSRIHRTYK